jgi:hypothetical protein
MLAHHMRLYLLLHEINARSDAEMSFEEEYAQGAL